MEQIQIRQPKMLVSQSFIQILRTFLAKIFIFLTVYFPDIKNNLLKNKTVKTIGSTRLSIKKSNLIYQRE